MPTNEQPHHVINISLDEHGDIIEELRNIIDVKLKYQLYKKDCYEKKKKSKKIQNFDINIKLSKITDNDGDNLSVSNSKIDIYETNDNNLSSIHLDVYDKVTSRLIISKQLSFPKMIDINEEIRYLDIEIDNSNIIIKLKNLLDKINNINNIDSDNENYLQINGNRIDNHTLSDLLGKYREEYNYLKNLYSSLVSSREQLAKSYDKYIDLVDKSYNKLDEYSQYLENQSTLSYIDILKALSESSNVDCLEYFRLKKKLYSNIDELRQYTQKRIEYRDVATGIFKLGVIVEDNEDDCTVLPDFEKDTVIVEKKNIINDNLETGIHERKKEVYDKLHLSSILDINSILAGEDTVFGKVVIAVYNTDTPTTKASSKNLNLLTQLESVLSNITNLNYYSGPFSQQELYDNNTITALIYGSEQKPSRPGKGHGEYISPSYDQTNPFDNLRDFTDWRIKLDNSYIKTSVFKVPSIVIKTTPFFVDNKPFNSFDHYYIWTLLNNRVDLSRNVMHKMQQLADSMLANSHGENQSKSSKYIFSLFEQTGLGPSDTWSEHSTDIIKKGLYAKFSQIPELKDILLATEKALLLNSNKEHVYNEQKYDVNHNLLDIRYMLLNNILPTEFYSNYNSDIEKVRINMEKIKHEISEITLQKEASLLDLYTTIGKNNPLPDKTEPRTAVIQEQIKETESLDTSYNASLKKLQNIVVTQYDSLVLDVPFNANSLYFSIVQGMDYKDIEPYNIRNNPDSELKLLEFKAIKYSEDNYQPFYVDAVNHLRLLISDKIKNNASVFGTNETLAQFIPDIQDAQYYIDMIDTVYTDESDFEASGMSSKIILLVSSALFNIDYNVIGIDEINTYQINSSMARSIFPEGEMYNTPDTKEVYLGNLDNKHFPNIVTRDLYDGLYNTWEKRTYYVVESNSVLIASYLDEEEQLEIQGIYDDVTKKIKDSTGDEDLDNILAENIEKYWENNSDDPLKNTDIMVVNYWINTTNNKVINEERGLVYIGQLKNKEDELGDIYSYIEFD